MYSTNDFRALRFRQCFVTKRHTSDEVLPENAREHQNPAKNQPETSENSVTKICLGVPVLGSQGSLWSDVFCIRFFAKFGHRAIRGEQVRVKGHGRGRHGFAHQIPDIGRRTMILDSFLNFIPNFCQYLAKFLIFILNMLENSLESLQLVLAFMKCF